MTKATKIRRRKSEKRYCRASVQFGVFPCKHRVETKRCVGHETSTQETNRMSLLSLPLRLSEFPSISVYLSLFLSVCLGSSVHHSRPTRLLDRARAEERHANRQTGYILRCLLYTRPRVHVRVLHTSHDLYFYKDSLCRWTYDCQHHINIATKI